MDQLGIGAINQCTTSGLLTTTGAETVHDTTVTICYRLDGKQLTKTAITNGATPTTDHNTGAAFTALIGGNSVANTPGQGTVVVWGLQSDGTVKCAMGSIEALDMDDGFVNAPDFPAIKGDIVPFAYTIYKAGATAGVSNIWGTTNWNATGVTATDVNIGRLPNRPQTS